MYTPTTAHGTRSERVVLHRPTSLATTAKANGTTAHNRVNGRASSVLRGSSHGLRITDKGARRRDLGYLPLRLSAGFAFRLRRPIELYRSAPQFRYMLLVSRVMYVSTSLSLRRRCVSMTSPTRTVFTGAAGCPDVFD